MTTGQRSWFGGSPRELLYDNPRTMVKGRDPVSGEVELTGTFKDFAVHYGVRPRLPPVPCPHEGEDRIGDQVTQEENFLAGRRFRDLDEMNRQIEEWLITEADVRIHGTTGVRPIDRFPHEQLIDTNHVPPYRLERVIHRQVSNDARVCFETNRSSVPWHFIRRQVEIRLHGDSVVLLHDGKEIARHPRLAGRFQERIDPAHFRGLFRMERETAEDHGPLHDPRFVTEDVMVRDLSLYDRVAGIGGHA